MRYVLTDREGVEIVRGEIITQGLPQVVIHDGKTFLRDRELESSHGPWSGNRVVYRRCTHAVLVGEPGYRS